jgi:hypothetical protein
MWGLIKKRSYFHAVRNLTSTEMRDGINWGQIILPE